ncbi:hypothetical protein ACPOL_5513 [Acidisarcina polymorpha]|uniref:Uncharacterized protein n=1 Tax=Acidisarcina polymorpha TaxID=2211140 RepID=A0A2Z5G6N7_9BACT|nr:hypothetical protein ACPOL_5513 [Acidisarcina polymorpha]
MLGATKGLNGVSRSPKSAFPITASRAYPNTSKRTFLNFWTSTRCRRCGTVSIEELGNFRCGRQHVAKATASS